MSQLSSEHIEITDQMSGQPKIKGRRISVHLIKIWHEDHGLPVADIAEDFGLTMGDVYDALAYYHDHEQEIEAQRAEIDAWVAEIKARNPSLLKQKLTEQGREVG